MPGGLVCTSATLVRAGLLAVAGARMARGLRAPTPITVADAPAGEAHPDAITVVIPARDEARRIGPVLAAMVDAPGVAEVIVVDDHSTDATAEVARRAGATVVAAPPLPDGWAGKAWALQTGLGAARTEWVVTLDADTEPHPGLAAAMVARARADGYAMLTVGGAFSCPTAGAQWLHPAMLTSLVYRFGAPGTETRPDRLMANGQAMVLCVEPVLAAGGLASVAGHPVEDVALARSLAATGLGVGFLEAGSLLTVRMYETLAETATGWGRSIALPGVEPRARQLFDAAVVVGVQAAAVPALVGLLWPGRRSRRRRRGRAGALFNLVTVALRVGTLVGTRRAYRMATGRRGVAEAAYWASPLADPLAAALLVRGVFSRAQQWRGRRYLTTPPARTAHR